MLDALIRLVLPLRKFLERCCAGSRSYRLRCREDVALATLLYPPLRNAAGVKALDRRQVLQLQQAQSPNTELQGHTLPLPITPAVPLFRIEIAATHTHGER